MDLYNFLVKYLDYFIDVLIESKEIRLKLDYQT